MPYAPIKNINFIGKKKSRNILSSVSSSSSSASPSPLPSPSSNEKISEFFSSLASDLSVKSAILSLVEPYSSRYVPKSLDEDLPMCLSTLFKPEYLTCSYGELLQMSKECNIVITSDQVQAVKSKTRSQMRCSLWFRMRSGRITASKFKNVSHTNEASPSISLIMTICHPELSRFSSTATTWGCEHEKVARDKYYSKSSYQHSKFTVSNFNM